MFSSYGLGKGVTFVCSLKEHLCYKTEGANIGDIKFVCLFVPLFVCHLELWDGEGRRHCRDPRGRSTWTSVCLAETPKLQDLSLSALLPMQLLKSIQVGTSAHLSFESLGRLTRQLRSVAISTSNHRLVTLIERRKTLLGVEAIANTY